MFDRVLNAPLYANHFEKIALYFIRFFCFFFGNIVLLLIGKTNKQTNKQKNESLLTLICMKDILYKMDSRGPTKGNTQLIRKNINI